MQMTHWKRFTHIKYTNRFENAEAITNMNDDVGPLIKEPLGYIRGCYRGYASGWEWTVSGQGRGRAALCFTLHLTSSYSWLKGSVINVILRRVPASAHSSALLVFFFFFFSSPFVCPLLVPNHPVPFLPPLSAYFIILSPPQISLCVFPFSPLLFSFVKKSIAPTRPPVPLYPLSLSLSSLLLVSACVITRVLQRPSGGQHAIYNGLQRASQPTHYLRLIFFFTNTYTNAYVCVLKFLWRHTLRHPDLILE